MNTSSFFTNKITNVPLHQYTENNQTSDLKVIENESSENDCCITNSLSTGSLELDGCSNVCIDGGKPLTSDLVLNSKGNTEQIYENEHFITTDEINKDQIVSLTSCLNIDNQVRELDNTNLELNNVVESVKPSSITGNEEIDSSNSTLYHKNDIILELGSSCPNTGTEDQIEPINSNEKDSLECVNSNFNLKVQEGSLSSSPTHPLQDHLVYNDLRSSQHLQNEQNSGSIDSLLAFGDELVNICPDANLEKSEKFKELEDSLFQDDSQNLGEAKEAMNVQIIEEEYNVVNQKLSEMKECTDNQMFMESEDAYVNEENDVSNQNVCINKEYIDSEGRVESEDAYTEVEDNPANQNLSQTKESIDNQLAVESGDTTTYIENNMVSQSLTKNEEDTGDGTNKNSKNADIEDESTVSTHGDITKNNENQTVLASTQTLTTEVNLVMASNNSSNNHELLASDYVFKEGLDHVSSSCQETPEVHSFSDPVNEHINNEEINPPDNNKSNEIHPPIFKHLLSNSEDNDSSSHSTLEPNNQLENIDTSIINDRLNGECKPVRKESSCSNQVDEDDDKEIKQDSLLKSMPSETRGSETDHISVTIVPGNTKKEEYRETSVPIDVATELKCDSKENEINVKNAVNIKKSLEVTHSVIDLSDGKETASFSGNSSCNVKFGLKHCQVDLGNSRISDNMLKTIQDPLENKPNFSRLKRKLEVMLQCAQKEEERALNQLKKMRVEKSTILEDILKEIQKVKKKFKV